MQGESSVQYEMFADLCGSVKNLTCPLSNSPILAVNKGLDDCIEIGERVSDADEVYLTNATNGLSGGFQLPFGQVRCCSNSQTRVINLTLKFLCNSNSPKLELSKSSHDVLSVIGDCNGVENLTITLLTAKLCHENIRPLASGWPAYAVALAIIGVVILVTVVFVVLCKRGRKSKKKDKTRCLVCAKIDLHPKDPHPKVHQRSVAHYFASQSQLMVTKEFRRLRASHFAAILERVKGVEATLRMPRLATDFSACM